MRKAGVNVDIGPLTRPVDTNQRRSLTPLFTAPVDTRPCADAVMGRRDTTTAFLKVRRLSTVASRGLGVGGDTAALASAVLAHRRSKPVGATDITARAATS